MSQPSDTKCRSCGLWMARLSFSSYGFCDDFCETRYYHSNGFKLPDSLDFRNRRRVARTRLWELSRQGPHKDICDTFYDLLPRIQNSGTLWLWLSQRVQLIAGDAHFRTIEQGKGVCWTSVEKKWSRSAQWSELVALKCIYHCFWK